MAGWAIVIGIDRYALEGATLQGAVADALAMREWLLSPEGGNVPEANLVLVLGRREPAGPNDVQAPDAIHANVITTIYDLVERSGGKGERLYFYYAGHGLSAMVDHSELNAIVAADFTRRLSQNSCSLRSLWEYFEALEFRDQFFFVDACRNVPWPGAIVPGRWTEPRTRNLGAPPAQQFILYATSPGLEAAELPDELGNERGAFTRWLLRGLGGEGTAKAWSWASQRYEVRWDRLVAYVLARMREEQTKVAAGPVQRALQIPQATGARGVADGDPNPALAAYPADRFAPEELKVMLAPSEVVDRAEIRILNDVADQVESRTQLTGVPVTFSLPPRTYSLRALAPEYADARAIPPVELYEPRDVSLNLEKAPVAPEAAAAPAEEAAPEAAPAPAATPAEEAAPAPAPPAPSAPGAAPAPATTTLVVQGSDPLASVEAADDSGRILGVGTGRLRLDDLPTGFYKARLRGPEGQVVEKLVELTAGEAEKVRLEAPQPGEAVAKLVANSDLQLHDDHTLQASDTLQPIATPGLSTVLALAGGAALHEGAAQGQRLRGLGLKSFRERVRPGAESGLYVLAGAEREVDDEAQRWLEGVRLRWWPIGQPVPDAAEGLAAFGPLPGLGEYAAEVPPGPHWLSVEVAGEPPLVFALAVLPRRLSMLVLQVDGERVQPFQYNPRLGGNTTSDLNGLRRLELMQRIQLDNRLDAGYDIAQELLRGKFDDPLAGCLGGYLMLRLGRASELAHAVGNLTRRYPQLSDCHVLRAEHAAATGDADAARQAVEEAIEVGLPMVGEGVTRLLDGLEQHRISHDNGRLLVHVHKGYVHGQLWTVWTPTVKPGQLLLP